MNCKLTTSLGEKRCEYLAGGALLLFLANYYAPVFSTSATAGEDGKIVYKTDAEGNITNVYLPEDEAFFPLIAEEATINFTDILQIGANSNKYRQHSVTCLANTDAIFEGTTRDDLSLGKFIAVVVDQSRQVFLLGALAGLQAPANGADYNSGTAVGDAVGLTLLLQGVQAGKEHASMAKLTSEAVITPIFTPAP